MTDVANISEPSSGNSTCGPGLNMSEWSEHLSKKQQRRRRKQGESGGCQKLRLNNFALWLNNSWILAKHVSKNKSSHKCVKCEVCW